MRIKINLILFLFSLSGVLFLSCQKEIDGLVNGVIVGPDGSKPKVGTMWTYRYYTYYSYGSLATSAILVFKAQSEDTLGGEKWLRIVDVATDTTVYFLNEKAGGLYQYTNSNSYLFCKNPAFVNDFYSSFFEGAAKDFIVKGVNDTLPTGVGDVPANYYEGYIGTNLIDQVWYNKNAWIVRKNKYLKIPLGNTYYRYSALFIDNIIY